VVHRDLKPDNVLFLNGRWCLADFGIARYAEAATAPDTRKYALTPAYAAPERWRHERATIAADVYSVGVMAFEMLTGELPFPGFDFRDQHLHQDPPVLAGVGPQLETLVSECLYKAPEARPRPANLAGRLSRAMDPVSPAAARLQEANQVAVREAQDHAIQASAQASEEERRAGLYAAGETSLARISGLLRQSIAESASAARFETRKNGKAWVATLNSAQLAFDQITRSQSGLLNAAFDVVAYSFVLLTVRGARAWEGRSHSLWFCDAQVEGEFRWFEVAFMLNPFIGRQTRVVPYGLEPGPQADEALGPGIGTHQVAFGPKAIDQGNEQWFVDRWMEMFAEAALGRLNHPSHLPERVESWRRS
jgi:serine/threonine-protein kinase